MFDCKFTLSQLYYFEKKEGASIDCVMAYTPIRHVIDIHASLVFGPQCRHVTLINMRHVLVSKYLCSMFQQVVCAA